MKSNGGNMKYLAMVFLALATAFPAWAAYDVTCFTGGCLKNGWEYMDRRGLNRGEVFCAEEGCLEGGWQNVEQGRLLTDNVCSEGECFKFGWRTFDARTGRLLAQTSCMAADENSEFDCLTQGWVTRDFVTGRQTTTTCTANDCRQQGWEVETPGYGLQIVRCKAGGCFEEGWNLRP